MTAEKFYRLVTIFFLTALSMYCTRKLLHGNYLFLIAAVFVGVLALMSVYGRYAPYVAFLLVNPFSALPYVPMYRFPTHALVILTCCLSYVLRSSTAKKSGQPRLASYNPLILIFFLVALAKYSTAPVLPGLALGTSADISGFRIWFDYGLSLAVILFFGQFVYDQEQVLSFTKYLLIFSVGFAVLFIILMPIQARRLSVFLYFHGVYVIFFGNGWRRFVVLPTFGFFMVQACLLPRVFPCSKLQRKLLLPLGLLCITAGSNRGSLVIIFLVAMFILFLQRRRTTIIALLLILLFLVVSVNVFVEKGVVSPMVPGVRMIGLFNKTIARETDGEHTVQWRVDRWKLAWNDIKRKPLFGSGYGGYKDLISTYSRFYSRESLTAEIDVASGNVHNGYISIARGLGIPAAILFIIILLRQFVTHLLFALRNRHTNVFLFQLNTFAAATLLHYGLSMIIGGGGHSPQIWTIIAMTVVIERFSVKEKFAVVSQAPSNQQEAFPGSMSPTLSDK